MLGRQHSTSCHELVGTRWQRRSAKAREQVVAEAALVPETSAIQGAGNSWGHGTSTKAMVRWIKRERSAASTVDVKREAGPPPAKKSKGKSDGKGGKNKRLHRRSRRCTVVFQLEFRWWDMWRAFTGKPMSGGQNSQMHHVPGRQAHGEAVPTDLTRSRNERNWHSGKGFSTLVGTWRRMFDFLALFSGFGEIRAGRGHLGSRSSARYQGQNPQPRHPPRWHRFACGRAL